MKYQTNQRLSTPRYWEERSFIHGSSEKKILLNLLVINFEIANNWRNYLASMRIGEVKINDLWKSGIPYSQLWWYHIGDEEDRSRIISSTREQQFSTETKIKYRSFEGDLQKGIPAWLDVANLSRRCREHRRSWIDTISNSSPELCWWESKNQDQKESYPWL